VEILIAVIGTLQEFGLEPFIVPAMGSHGGGTAEGQSKVLAGYGITEKSMGVPVVSSMGTVQVGVTKDRVPVRLDQRALEADWTVVVNRVKPHTRFSGPFESGLAKMLMVGLGKHSGAVEYHLAETRIPFERLVRTAVPVVLREMRVLFGLGIVENAYKETARVVAVSPEDLLRVEEELLVGAKKRMPRLPFKSVDVMIVDRMGKNFSGVGVDTNVVGNKSGIDIGRLYIRGLHRASGGNATGVGVADMVHQRLVHHTNLEVTKANCLTSLNFDGARMPMAFKTDTEAIDVALGTSGDSSTELARVCWIRNTSDLGEIAVSERLMQEVKNKEGVKLLRGPFSFEFDVFGDLQNLPWEG